MNYRKADIEDIPYINEIYSLNREVVHGNIRDFEMWSKLLSNSEQEHFIIYDKEPVGWFRIDRGDNSLELGMLQIHPKYQHQGIGKSVINEFEKIAKDRGIEIVIIHTTEDNKSAQRLYISCGYTLVEVGDCTTADGVSRVGHTYLKNLSWRYILETERLILREMGDSDFEALKKVISDPINMKYYDKPYDDYGVQRWIDWCKDSYLKHNFGLWAVVLKETGEMIGDCGISIQIIDDEPKPEVGYHLRRDYHRKGIGKEMTQAVRDYFFTHFDYDEVYSYMNKNNIPSMKTAEANGMKYLHLYTSHGEVCRVYRITREEWKELKK